MKVRSTAFERRPAPGPFARELNVEIDGIALSGLAAFPPDTSPRALIVAIHGLGMHAGYFDSHTAPGLSLLQLASETGYAVWAPDRPGTGGSTDVPEESLTLFGQADLLLRAVDAFKAEHAPDTGVVLVGHSYGLKVSWAMAARDRARRLLGVDGASSGITYGFEWTSRPDPESITEHRPPVLNTWGPRTLYPRRAFDRSAIPTHDDPAVQRTEGPRWPAEIRTMGHRIAVPMRITFGDHETIWPLSRAHFDDMRAVFRGSPDLEITVEPHAGHNLSLGWAARAYHLKVLTFVERCRLSHQLG